MFDEALAALAAGATVLTPTRRLAHAIQHAYDAARRAAGERTWSAPDVLPWGAWQQRLWEGAQLGGGVPLPLLLNPQQELALWERIIGETHAVSALLHLESTAEAARDAWQLGCAWRLAPLLQRTPLTDEARAFLGWSEAFTHFCARGELLDSARLPDRLGALLREGALAAPRPIALCGFDGTDPQRDALLSALRAAGTAVEVLAGERPPGEAGLVAAHGARDEMQAAARWARAQLEAEPEALIGIVVPDLARARADVARTLDEALVPDAILTPGEERQRPWNLSLGLPLAHWPVVHAALLVLELAAHPRPGDGLPAQSASLLLRSPFLGGAQSERNARALLDERLRRAGEPRVGIEALMRFARDESRASACPLLLDQLGRLRARARDLHDALLSPSAWGPRLQALLAAMGWPGERPLDSEEFQTVEAWRGLLTGLAHLDLVHGAVGFGSARSLVGRLAAQRLFQPETPPVPVQVLGVLESAGLEFDHLWVTGLHADAWPRAAHPNPLLPVELQRRLGVPGGCPEWELGFAQRMLAGWRRAAPRVLFSYPQAENDRTLLPSPLLADAVRVHDPLGGARPAPGLRELVHAARRLEELEDIQASALPPGVAFSGGARLIQDQAACPFRAFAVHRLGARGLEQAHEGLDARERGNLLHAVLTVLWDALRDSEALLAPDAVLAAAVTDAVELTVRQWQGRRGAALPAGFLALERERLRDLLLEWLAVERSRAPFEVLATERQLAADVGGVRLELRTDRVDRLRDASEMVIDYKTGEAAVKAWFGPRPDEPQLPLYALARDPPPLGLAFARVKRGQCAFAGLAAVPATAPGVKALGTAKGEDVAEGWDAQLAQWRATLNALGAQFRAGHARVAPKAYPHTCRYCDLATLCRVSELQEAADEADEDAQD